MSRLLMLIAVVAATSAGAESVCLPDHLRARGFTDSASMTAFLGEWNAWCRSVGGRWDGTGKCYCSGDYQSAPSEGFDFAAWQAWFAEQERLAEIERQRDAELRRQAMERADRIAAELAAQTTRGQMLDLRASRLSAAQERQRQQMKVAPLRTQMLTPPAQPPANTPAVVPVPAITSFISDDVPVVANTTPAMLSFGHLVDARASIVLTDRDFQRSAGPPVDVSFRDIATTVGEAAADEAGFSLVTRIMSLPSQLQAMREGHPVQPDQDIAEVVRALHEAVRELGDPATNYDHVADLTEVLGDRFRERARAMLINRVWSDVEGGILDRSKTWLKGGDGE